MIPLTPPPLPKKKRRAKLLVWGLVVLAIGLIAFLAVFVTARWRWHRDVEEQIVAAKRKGHPTTAEELNSWYSAVPASNNAAIFYEALFRHMPTNRQQGKFPSLRRNELLS